MSNTKRALVVIALVVIALVVIALASRVTAQPAASVAGAAGPTSVPYAPTVYPTAAPAAGALVGLKYDETDCDPANLAACRNAGQPEFPAVYVRNIQSGDRTLKDGIIAIQKLFAATPGSQTWDSWTTLGVDTVRPTFVWCPAGCGWVPDTAFPLLGIPGLESVAYTIGIVQAHSPADPPAGITQVACPAGDCWAGLMR